MFDSCLCFKSDSTFKCKKQQSQARRRRGEATQHRLQGIVVVYGLIVLIANLLIDIALVCLDPRSALKDS